MILDLPKDLYNKLLVEAKKQNISVGALIRQTLKESTDI